MQVIIPLNFLMNSATTCIYALSESLLEEVWTQLEKCHAPPFKWSLKYVPNVDFYLAILELTFVECIYTSNVCFFSDYNNYKLKLKKKLMRL